MTLLLGNLSPGATGRPGDVVSCGLIVTRSESFVRVFISVFIWVDV